jgi:hypothetical protein
MWLADLPVAVTLSWQLTQPVVTPAWSKRPPSQDLVSWHSSQSLPLGMWLADLPVAVTLSWQLAQPVVIPV